MKIRKKIAAAVTAAALMFSLTDPSALGGMLNAASTAFAATDITQIVLRPDKQLKSPVAATNLWLSGAVGVTDEFQVDLSQTVVEWYNADTNQQVTSGEADYDTTYYVKIKFIPGQGYVAASSVTFKYYTEATGSSVQTAAATFEGDYIVLTVKLPKTGLPEAEQAVFPASAISDGTSNRVAIDLPVYQNKNSVIAALPIFATILTGTAAHRGKSIENVPITWVNSAGNFTYEDPKKTFNENDINGHDFTVVGTVKAENYGSYVTNTNAVFNVYCKVTIGAADQLEAPEPRYDTPAGSYDHNLTVYFTAPEGDIYYTVSESRTGPDPIGGNASQKYLNGVPLSVDEGDTRTFYIKVLAYSAKKRTSTIAIYEYTITVEPTSLTNIPEVYLEVTPPVGGEMLDTIAKYKGGTPPKGVAITSAVAWLGNVVNGRADYNAAYSVSIQITPKSMYAFNKTTAYVNDILAKCTTNESGTLTVTYTFPGRTDKLPLYRIIPPADTVVVENGTDIQDIGDQLPKMVEVEAPKGAVLANQYPVKWDLNTSDPLYDPKLAKSQEFTITGKVTLPDFITYNEGENEVKVNVFVGTAGSLAWPTASPSDSTQGHMFYDAVEVKLSASEGATIYYTIGENKQADVPTVTGGKAYNAPIILMGEPGEITTYYIKAIAVAPGKNDSPVNSFVYTITLPKRSVDAPTANYKSGEYQQALDIALNSTTVGAEIRYTLDPTAKLAEFKKYDGVFRLSGEANTTKVYNLRFYALDPTGKMIQSDIITRKYTITIPKNKALAPYPDKTAGITYDKAISVTLKTDTSGATIYYTLDGSDPKEAGKGILYKSPITLAKKVNTVTTYTIKTYAKSSNLNMDDSATVTYTYYIGEYYGVKSIEITKVPTKTSYYLGERLNVSGGKIKVTYDDGKTETIDMDEDMIDDFDNWAIGQQTLVVYYKGCTDSYNVVVRRRPTASSDDPVDPSKDNPKDDPKDDPTDDPTNDDPDQPASDPVVPNTTIKGWTAIQKRIASAEKGSRVKIKLNGTTSVPADIINSAIKRKLTLEFIVNDNISWVIDTGSLKKTVASFSAGVKIKDVYIPSVLVDNAGGSEVMRIHTYGANKIGAVLYVNTDSKTKNRFANLFWYNEDTSQLDFESTSKVSTSTGIATLVPTSGGEHVIMLDTQTRLPGDADNSTKVDAKDASVILQALARRSDELDETWDFNNDGLVNALDCADILRSVVGLKKK